MPLETIGYVKQQSRDVIVNVFSNLRYVDLGELP